MDTKNFTIKTQESVQKAQEIAMSNQHQAALLALPTNALRKVESVRAIPISSQVKKSQSRKTHATNL